MQPSSIYVDFSVDVKGFLLVYGAGIVFFEYRWGVSNLASLWCLGIYVFRASI